MAERMDRRINYLAAAWCNNTFAYSITFPFLPLYLRDVRHLSELVIGMIFPLLGAGRMLGSPAAGWLVDKIGRRKILLGAPTVRAAAFFLLSWLVHLDAPIWIITVVLIVATMMGSAFQSASDSYITDITLPELRTDAFSRIRVGLNVGWAIGPAVGAFLARTPFSLLFGITGVVCLFTTAIGYFSCPEATRAERSGEDAQARQTPLWRIMKEDATFLWMCLFCLALYVVHAQLLTTFSLYASGHVRVSQNCLGALYSINGMMVIFLLLPLNLLMKRMIVANRIAFGCAMYAVGYFVLGFAADGWGLLAGVVFFTLGEMLTESAVATATSRLAPRGYVGRYMGIYGLMSGLGFLVGPFFGALLLETYRGEPTSTWTIVALCAAFAAYGFWRLRREERLQQPSPGDGAEYAP